jgi:hypothetical protein
MLVNTLWKPVQQVRAAAGARGAQRTLAAEQPAAFCVFFSGPMRLPNRTRAIFCLNARVDRPTPPHCQYKPAGLLFSFSSLTKHELRGEAPEGAHTRNVAGNGSRHSTTQQHCSSRDSSSSNDSRAPVSITQTQRNTATLLCRPSLQAHNHVHRNCLFPDGQMSLAQPTSQSRSSTLPPHNSPLPPTNTVTGAHLLPGTRRCRRSRQQTTA